MRTRLTGVVGLALGLTLLGGGAAGASAYGSSGSPQVSTTAAAPFQWMQADTGGAAETESASEIENAAGGDEAVDGVNLDQQGEHEGDNVG